MSPPPSASNTPPNRFTPSMPANQEAAIEAFLSMARSETSDPGEMKPTLKARNYSAPAAHPYRVRFDLRDPDPTNEQEGDQDHFLFKAPGNTHNRTHKGQRCPQDYDPERAKRIGFIPETLLEPDFVYRIRLEPWKVAYVAQTAPDEYFFVLLEELKGNPRFNFSTAYSLTIDEYKSIRDKWQRLFPCNPKRQKK